VLDLTESMKRLLLGTGNAMLGASVQDVQKIFGEGNVVRFFLNAAMCQWVFESDFPQIDGNDSRMVWDYRNHLAQLKSKTPVHLHGVSLPLSLDSYLASIRILRKTGANWLQTD
jgi:hypothetical protein